jgi:hypothetical protein
VSSLYPCLTDASTRVSNFWCNIMFSIQTQENIAEVVAEAVRGMISNESR